MITEPQTSSVGEVVSLHGAATEKLFDPQLIFFFYLIESLMPFFML